MINLKENKNNSKRKFEISRDSDGLIASRYGITAKPKSGFANVKSSPMMNSNKYIR